LVSAHSFSLPVGQVWAGSPGPGRLRDAIQTASRAAGLRPPCDPGTSVSPSFPGPRRGCPPLWWRCHGKPAARSGFRPGQPPYRAWFLPALGVGVFRAVRRQETIFHPRPPPGESVLPAGRRPLLRPCQSFDGDCPRRPPPLGSKHRGTAFVAHLF